MLSMWCSCAEAAGMNVERSKDKAPRDIDAAPLAMVG